MSIKYGMQYFSALIQCVLVYVKNILSWVPACSMLWVIKDPQTHEITHISKYYLL